MNFDITMIRAATILVVLVAILFVYEFMQPNGFSVTNLSISLSMDIAWAIFLVYLVRNMRTRTTKCSVKEIGVWGYVWRSLVIKYFAFFGALITVVLIAGEALTPSIFSSLIMYGCSFIMSVVFAWALFSSDRKGQLVWVLTLIRGY